MGSRVESVAGADWQTFSTVMPPEEFRLQRTNPYVRLVGELFEDLADMEDLVARTALQRLERDLVDELVALQRNYQAKIDELMRLFG